MLVRGKTLFSFSIYRFPPLTRFPLHPFNSRLVLSSRFRRNCLTSSLLPSFLPSPTRQTPQLEMAFILPTATAARPTPYRQTFLRIAAHSHHSSPTVRLQKPHVPAYVLFPAPPPPPSPHHNFADRPDRPESDSALPSLAALWRAYNHYLTTAPLLTKALSASVLVLISDICAQALTHTRDLSRLARSALYGLLLAGPMGHYWFLTLDSLVTLSGPAGVLLKVAVDQLAFAPFATALFFAVMKLAEGLSFSDLLSFFHFNFASTMLSGYKLWPLANAVNFAFIPVAHRVVFTSAVSVFWISFLSVVSNRTASPAQADTR